MLSTECYHRRAACRHVWHHGRQPGSLQGPEQTPDSLGMLDWISGPMSPTSGLLAPFLRLEEAGLLVKEKRGSRWGTFEAVEVFASRSCSFISVLYVKDEIKTHNKWFTYLSEETCTSLSLIKRVHSCGPARRPCNYTAFIVDLFDIWTLSFKDKR